jgi:hypothetical protein
MSRALIELGAAAARQQVKPMGLAHLFSTPAEVAAQQAAYDRWCAMSDEDVCAEVSANLEANRARWEARRLALVDRVLVQHGHDPRAVLDALEAAGYLSEF